MRRLPALAGAGFVLCVVFAFSFLSSDTPGSEDSAATINAYYDAHHTKEIAAALLIAAAVPLLVIFGMTLASALWPRDHAQRRPIWQTVLAGGSIISAACWLVSAMIHFALADAADQHGMAGGALQALNVLDADTFILFASGLGVMLLGAAGALFARKVHPILAWIGLATAILLFIPYADFAGFILSGLWIIATSVLLYRRGEEFAS